MRAIANFDSATNSSIRAVALYRASTKAQTDKENNNDIPTQKKIVQDFIFSEGWKLLREFTEGGVSGFKVSEKNRDALQIIKAMAVNSEFDVLVVYMSDRIGRIADETPLVISFLYQHNVRVFSCAEGEIASQNQNDKLMTYLRYWQSEGESIKTQKRVTDYILASVEEGKFKGGNCAPLGYMLIDKGSRNYKGRKILDIVINPEEVNLVKLIYSLSMEMNYGQKRIGEYLNEHGYRTREGKPWKSASVQHVLSNTIYKGQFSVHSKLYDKTVVSPVKEELIIIPEHEWEENRRIIATRTTKKKEENYKRTRNTYGKLLLSGIIYCGHCGQKLTTFLESKRYTSKRTKDITTSYSYRYRCMSFYKRGAINCDGQSAYGAKKINSFVVAEVKSFVLELQGKNLNQEFMNNIKNQLKVAEVFKAKKQNVLSELYAELKVLKDEIVKSLMNKSQFKQETLKELIASKEQEIKQCNTEFIVIESRVKDLHSDIKGYGNLKHEFVDWTKKYDTGDDELKKKMLLSIIDKVRVFKDKIEITFNTNVETYKANSSTLSEQERTTS